MLLQKGNQYQSGKSQPPGQQTQLFPTQTEPQVIKIRILSI